MQMSKVLIVDGNRAARDALVTCLQFIGVEAHGAECAVSANFWLATGSADVLVLSDELAEGGLAELVQRCGPCDSNPKIPILVLTRDGAHVRLPPNYPVDETLRRPVPVSRVVERIESLIDQRRNANRVRITFGALSVDTVNARAELGAASLPLGRTEARLLAFFMGTPDKVFSRAQLLLRLWPANVCVEERTVDVYIRRLRSVLAELGCANYIQTVRGSGYRFSRQLD
jgi:two-component system phosphate regulon response regulator PhoB